MFASLGLIVIIVGAIVGQSRYARILAKQRNAESRYMPEYEASYVPRGLRRTDTFVSHLSHRGGPDIDNANDAAPHVRAAYFRAVALDVPAPPAPGVLPGVPTGSDAVGHVPPDHAGA